MKVYRSTKVQNQLALLITALLSLLYGMEAAQSDPESWEKINDNGAKEINETVLTRSRVDAWEAGVVVDNADLIAVIGEPSTLIGSVPVTGVFKWNGEAQIRQVVVKGVLSGQHRKNVSLVIIEPPGRHLTLAPRLRRGDYVVFLRRVSSADVDTIRRGARSDRIARRIPDVVWTFASDGFDRWMSVVRLSSEDGLAGGLLAASIKRHANVSRDSNEILSYIRDLLALREAVIRGDSVDEKDLDPFQRLMLSGGDENSR